MRLLLTFALLGLFGTLASAQDSTPPTVQITHVVKTKQGRVTTLDFYLKATDDVAASWVECRAAVDGKQGPWRRYEYFDFPGYPFHLPYRVNCFKFVFEVCSVDSSGNKSPIAKKVFLHLRSKPKPHRPRPKLRG